MNKSIIIFLILISICESCSIFPLLNCSCYQSNIDFNSSIQIYSHLYCHGEYLTEKTFEFPFGIDYEYQNSFRTISIEFSNQNQMKIHSNQFNSLSMLFSRTDSQIPIDISFRFTEFNQIILSENSITSKMFHSKHEHRRLWIYLIPKRMNSTQIEFDSENLTNIENQFDFSSNCFNDLNVSEFSIYIHTKQDDLPLKYSFEQIFNNTNIGQLNFHGAIIRPELNENKTMKYFGHIRSLKVHRHVDIIDGNTFPYYSNVYSYTIHSIEAHSINLTSFILSHKNLRGLEIIKPRFDLSIDQFLPTLDSLTLDIENLTKRTLLIARHIHNLKLGSQLRRIDPEIFQYLSRRLHHLDLFDIDLTQMTSESRCYLLQYLSKHFQDHLNIIYPRLKYSYECHCDLLFLQYIQYRMNLNHSSCSTICHFSDCSIISDYFKQNFPLINSHNQQFQRIIHQDKQITPIEVFSDSLDIDIANFLNSQTSDQERNETQRRPIIDETQTIATLENIQEYEEVFISSTMPNFIQSFDEQITGNSSISFSWLSFTIGVIVVILLLIIFSLIAFCIIKYRKNHNFKPVPVYV